MFIDLEQLERIFSKININKEEGLRDFAMDNILAFTGVKASELVTANFEDLERCYDGKAAATLRVDRKGGDKNHYIILMPNTLDPLERYIQKYKMGIRGGYLFSSCSDTNKGQRLTAQAVRVNFKKYSQDADMEISLKSLQHFFISYSSKLGASVSSIMDATGIYSLDRLGKYLHTIKRGDEAAEYFIDKLRKED